MGIWPCAPLQRVANLPLPVSDVGVVAVTAGMYDTADVPTALDALGRTLYRPFCVSVHEHAWIAARYGVLGIWAYLERVRTYLDWAVVSPTSGVTL